MDNVGESKTRNEEYHKNFSRARVIKNTIKKEVTNPVIFDIGGHIGESIFFLRRVFPDALIFSFEPDPDSFLKLKALADKKTFCFNLAFSDSEGQVDFFRNKIGHTNSLLPVNLNSKDSIYLQRVRNSQEIFDVSRFNSKTIINSKRLDNFCEEKKIEHIDLLKIDVQGAETKVLRGAGNILELVENIIIEISFFDYYSQQSSFYDVERVILPFGFKLFSLTEISNNPMNGRTDWVEAIYTKTDENSI